MKNENMTMINALIETLHYQKVSTQTTLRDNVSASGLYLVLSLFEKLYYVECYNDKLQVIRKCLIIDHELIASGLE